MANDLTARAIEALRTRAKQFSSLQAMAEDLAASSKHTFSKGYLHHVMNGKRPPSKELLIALGLRKPPKVLSEAEREARKESRKTTEALWILHMAAHAGYTVSITRITDPMPAWAITIQHLTAYDQIRIVDSSFIDGVQRAHQIRFARMTNGKS